MTPQFATPIPTRLAAGLAVAGLVLAAGPVSAEWISVTQPVRAGVVLERDYLVSHPGAKPPGAIESLEDVIGLETRVSLYPGRPIHSLDVGPPTLVRRNDIVTVVFVRGALQLQTEGRALDGGGVGERVQVMNLDSRRTVWGSVAGDKLIEVR